jgi:hypothetical protein
MALLRRQVTDDLEALAPAAGALQRTRRLMALRLLTVRYTKRTTATPINATRNARANAPRPRNSAGTT